MHKIWVEKVLFSNALHEWARNQLPAVHEWERNQSPDQVAWQHICF